MTTESTPVPSPAAGAARRARGDHGRRGGRPLARDARHHRRLRPARRRDPARLRPAARQPQASATSSCATSRAPATRPRATRRRAASSASPSPPPAPVRPTSSPRSRTRTWTRCRSSRSPARCSRTSMGTDAFQEADIVGITMPITKHSFLVTRAGGHPRDASPRRTTSPPPAARARCSSTSPRTRSRRSAAVPLAAEGRPARLPPDHEGARQAGRRGRAAARRGEAPGALRGRRRHPLARVGRTARRSPRPTGAPVVTTLMARGAFPDSHQQHLGMPGMHGTVPAVLALQEADLLVALGARFDDRVTGKAAQFAPERQGRARRHRPRRDLQDPHGRRADRRRR